MTLPASAVRRLAVLMLGLVALVCSRQTVHAAAAPAVLPPVLEELVDMTKMPPPLPIVFVGAEWRAPTTRIIAWGPAYLSQMVPPGLEDVVQVSLGTDQMLALRADGTVVAWGTNSYGLLDVPPGLSHVVAVGAAGTYSTALKSDGSIVQWGLGGQAAVPAGLRVVKLATGTYHSLGLRADGRVVAWGDSMNNNANGQCDVPAGLRGVIAVAAGERHSLALKADGTVVAWGNNDFGQCNVPNDLRGVQAISAGIDFSLALKTDGKVVAWGTRLYGSTSVPEGLSDVVSIAAYAFTGMALKADGTLVAWGLDPTHELLPPPALGGVVSLGSGSSSASCMAVVVRSVERGWLSQNWGSSYRELRLRNPNARASLKVSLQLTGPHPEVFSLQDEPSFDLPPKGSRTFDLSCFADANVDARLVITASTQVAPGVFATLYPPQTITVSARGAKLGVVDALGDDVSTRGQNKVRAWGQGLDPSVTTDQDPNSIIGATAISSAGMYNSALTPGGNLAVWSYASPYQSAFAVPDAVAIAQGAGFTLALTSQGKVVGDGVDFEGLMHVPDGLSDVVALAANGHSLALKADGTVVQWGNGMPDQEDPSPVPPWLRDVTAISAGFDGLSLALRADGSVVAWGSNAYGQAAPSPNLTGVKAIAAGRYHSLALLLDGTVTAWGRNDADRLLKIPAGLSDVTAIAAGGAHSAALRTDGTVVTWGRGAWPEAQLGQIAPPPRLSGVTAISAGYMHTVALVEGAGVFAATPVMQQRPHHLAVHNEGKLKLRGVHFVIGGQDAAAFQVVETMSRTVGYLDKPFSLVFTPLHTGIARAELVVSSKDLREPFILPLCGTGAPFQLTAARAGTRGSIFTYAPLRPDPATGLLLQRITFNNTTGSPLHGLRLTVSRMAPGLFLYGSSATGLPRSVEVHYTSPIAVNQIVGFDLVYLDPLRRPASTFNPLIKATPLEEAESPPGPLNGTLVPLRSVRDTPNGPLLDWSTTPGKTYVVEYSNDQGKTWYSAMHRLVGGTRLIWGDRGQPETFYKPVNKAARMYRVREL